MSTWRNSLESWLKKIDVNGSCLDVGGGQLPVRGRTKTWNVSKYLIVDNRSGPTHKSLSDDDIFGESIDYPDAVFASQFRCDNVFMLETLMYSFNPYQAMFNVIKCVNQGGHLYISNPLEAYGETKPAGTDMVRLFPGWFERMLLPDFEIKEALIVEPEHDVSIGNFDKARALEGYKMIRPHAAGLLIHAVKVR